MQKTKRARPIQQIRDFNNEVVLDDFIVPRTSHDEENPIIKVGDTIVDKDAFIHTIK